MRDPTLRRDVSDHSIEHTEIEIISHEITLLLQRNVLRYDTATRYVVLLF